MYPLFTTTVPQRPFLQSLLPPSLQARPLSEIGVEPTTLIFDHTHVFGSWHFADH